MAIILSCGHREDNFDKHYSIMTKEWSRENTKAVAYKCVCLNCFREYEKSGDMFYSDKEAMEWLT